MSVSDLESSKSKLSTDSIVVPDIVREPVHETFSQDFRRFFVRGLKALLPTLITLWLMLKIWEFLWEYIGFYIILGLRHVSEKLPVGITSKTKDLPFDLKSVTWSVQLTGVVLAILLVYVVGLLAGNFIGRAAWALAERTSLRIPMIRAIYPAVKQITDFVLAERSGQFASARVVAVEPHAKGIWSIGLVTGTEIKALSESIGTELLTVFIPSSPTAFTGYVIVVPRQSIIELPLTVEQAIRLLVSGGVIDPQTISSSDSRVG